MSSRFSQGSQVGSAGVSSPSSFIPSVCEHIFSLVETGSGAIATDAESLFARVQKVAEVDAELQKSSTPHKDLCRYSFLQQLRAHDEASYYATLLSDLPRYLPIVYTPVVGLACEQFSNQFPLMGLNGLFLTPQAGVMSYFLGAYTKSRAARNEEVAVVVVTDGGRILGLGDLGANGMGISAGKASLYVAAGGIAPHRVVAVVLDSGSTFMERGEEQRRAYVGLRKFNDKSLKDGEGKAFSYETMQTFVDTLKRNYPNAMLQFEDFNTNHAFELMDAYRHEISSFNDDIQGTAAVGLAGLMSAADASGIPLHQHTFLFVGAGSASLGMAALIVDALTSPALSLKGSAPLDRHTALSRIFLVDSKGLISKKRKEYQLATYIEQVTNEIPHASQEQINLEAQKRLDKRMFEDREKLMFAKEHADPSVTTTLYPDILEYVKPSILIGLSGQPGVFTKDILQHMANLNEKPIVFALSNPKKQAECSFQEAMKHTNYNVIFASGSPFDPVLLPDGRTYVNNNQCNNMYIFPAIGLAHATAGLTAPIDKRDFLIAAAALSEMTNNQRHDGNSHARLFPPVEDIRRVSAYVATQVLKFRLADGQRVNDVDKAKAFVNADSVHRIKNLWNPIDLVKEKDHFKMPFNTFQFTKKVYQNLKENLSNYEHNYSYEELARLPAKFHNIGHNHPDQQIKL